MPEALLPILVPIVVIYAILAIASHFLPEDPEPETIEIRPTLTGEDLKQWTAIYQAISINYQRTLAGESTIADMAWSRWSQVTGKNQWKTVPNPNYKNLLEETL